ncbi:MAG: chloride channel protein [Oscillibacter sp.]|nr:chloride channel protein [Oscillibacter sp.]
MTKLVETLKHTKYYLQALVKWVTLAVLIGFCCGVVGVLFHLGVEWATKYRESHVFLLWSLPLAGLFIVGFYKLTRTEGQGTNDIIDAVRMGKSLSILLLPAIFVGTILTHLCGGSAGREGAALQMGGDIGYHVGLLFRMDDRDMRTATLCGMAAFFSALFGTPLTATVFAMVVISVGVLYHAAFIPCFTASLVAYGISVWVGVSPTHFTVTAPTLDPAMLLRVAALGALCALVAVLFCNVLRATGEFLRKHIQNPWLRVICGGFLIIGLSYLVRTSDYNGVGMDVIQRAVEEGTASPAAFLLKILFTAITLGAGYKGGEVVPSFFVGATFGCVVGPLLGLPAGFSAAVGLVAVFCASVNCPVASIFLSVELFGSAGVLYFALACGISYMLSGYNGLYSSQTILYSKLKAQYINARTNSYHAGDVPPDHSDLRTRE